MKKILVVLLAGFVFLVLDGCKDRKGGSGSDADSLGVNLGEIPDSLRMQQRIDSFRLTEVSKDTLLTQLTREVLTAFKTKNYSRLDSLIHPAEGVRFSPYGTVHTEEDRKFTREAFKKLTSSGRNKKINWGSFDGSGDEILLTPEEYFKKFVYDANFVRPEKYAINSFIGEGNSRNNLKAAYGDGDFTESYFSGSKKYGGMDWKSVRLVFKPVQGRYYLVGVVHDQWTI